MAVYRLIRCAIIVLGMSVTSLMVQASEPALMEGPNAKITGADIRADALRMPPEMRGIVLTKPQTVSQMASNLYARRVMGEEAVRQKLDQDPVIAAALQVARDKVLSDALLAKIDQDNTPSDADAEGMARTLYLAKPERFQQPVRAHVAHILIPMQQADAPELADKTLQELKTGADFAQLAKERSADPGSSSKGGEIAPFPRGSMVPEFEKAAFALSEPGQLSAVVKSKFGYHVIKLIEQLPAGTKSFAEVRDELIKEVRSTQQHQARVAAAQKIQGNAKLDEKAIEAFAASYANTAR